MTCHSPGYQQVKPLVSSEKEEVTRHLFISQSYFSFAWYAAMPIDSYWTTTIPGNRQYVNLQIRGQPVSFQDRFIISSWHTFYWPEPEVPVKTRDVSLRLAHGSPLKLTWATCENYRVLVLSDLGTFITKDAFGTYSEVKVNPGIVPVPPEGFFTIEEAALLDDGIILRIKDALYWRDSHDQSLTQDPQLPSSGIIGIHLRTSCVDFYPAKKVKLASLAVWQDHNLFIGGSRFKDKSRKGPYLQMVMALPANLTIMRGVFGSLPTTVHTLVGFRYPGGAIRPFIFTYDQMTPDQRWSASTLLAKTATEDIPSAPFDILFLDSSQPALLLWNYKIIHYSFRNDMEWGVLTPPDLFEASGGSSIEQVIMDPLHWSFLVKMENNVLFYCKVGVYSLVRLHTWIEPEEQMMLYNLGGQFYIVTLLQDARIDIHRKGSTGVETMELLPSQIGNTCTLPKSRISHFQVGCPSNRHIRIIRYDGDVFVRDVEANFILWERFGRKDFSFSKTMREVGCLRLAQTWSSMTQQGKSIPEAWGPHNYQSCFTLSPGKLGDLDQPYEIMNDSSRNHITFSQTDSATYVFSVKVLDPNYSFCDLQATFAIKTFGISKP
ncbi:cation channel sperm-associated auxiliary subunit epsilon-like [Aplochiton taeniatus]